MKRFLLFTYAEYYPSGGWNDYKGSFDSKEEAFAHWTKLVNESDYEHEYGTLVDLEEKSSHTFVYAEDLLYNMETEQFEGDPEKKPREYKEKEYWE